MENVGGDFEVKGRRVGGGDAVSGSGFQGKLPLIKTGEEMRAPQVFGRTPDEFGLQPAYTQDLWSCVYPAFPFPF